MSTPDRPGEAGRDATMYLGLVLVYAAVAAMSYRGLVGFARTNLHLSGWWPNLVPVSLDWVALLCSFLAVRYATDGESGATPRLMVWLFAGGAAAVNWIHVPHQAGWAGAREYYAGMSLGSAAVFELILRYARRRSLRASGLVESPLPRIRLVRWLVAPRETAGAWRYLVLNGGDSMADAVREWRRLQGRCGCCGRRQAGRRFRRGHPAPAATARAARVPAPVPAEAVAVSAVAVPSRPRAVAALPAGRGEKKRRLYALLETNPAAPHRRVSDLARELAPQVELHEGTARRYIADWRQAREAASA